MYGKRSAARCCKASSPNNGRRRNPARASVSARFNDELSNIIKFFGDWRLARIYERIAQRFHLSDRHRTVDGKLKTLDDLYRLLKLDQTHRWMIILEATIVLLSIIDLVVLEMGLKG